MPSPLIFSRLFLIDSRRPNLYFNGDIMKPIFIGKGMYRIIVRSKAKRDRLSKIPDVHIEGTRVVFPGWLTGNIRRIVAPHPKKSTEKAEQTELFHD